MRHSVNHDQVTTQATRETEMVLRNLADYDTAFRVSIQTDIKPEIEVAS